MSFPKADATIGLWSAAVTLVFAFLPLVATAQDQADTQQTAESKQEDNDSGDGEQSASQRIDFGIDFYETSDGSVIRGGINYNWVPLADHSIAATMPIIDSELGQVDGSGIGDLLLRYNWVPALTLTADPWVPNSLGIGLGLLIPTGDAAKGTGGGN